MSLRRLRADLWRAFNKRRTVCWFLRAWGRAALPGRRRRGAAGGRALPGGSPRTGESAPAFDLRVYNPIHWPRHDSALVAALGPLGRLPAEVEADRAVRRRDPLRLRRFHHLEDVGAFHADPVARAGEMVRLAAAGVVVHVADAGAGGGADAGPRLRALLGGELWRLMTAGVAGLDPGARELRSIAMRRAALRSHSTWARETAHLPPVSVLLATRRPALLPQALAAVARQRYPRLELVLALHGNESALPAVRRRVAGLPLPATVVPVPGGASLGAALNAAAAAAGGALLTKMDDDDRYGADHVWDLVLARAYSQAELVGKGAEFVYLAASHRTACDAASWRPEVYGSRGLAGGTLLISRRDLQRVGGWRELRRGVDQALIGDVLRRGGGVYRTHGAGFALVRHGDRHTWRVGDEWFLAKAVRVIPGWAAGAAGIGEPVGSGEPDA